jgi:hypothetical protein
MRCERVPFKLHAALARNQNMTGENQRLRIEDVLSIRALPTDNQTMRAFRAPSKQKGLSWDICNADW